jgi:hypothetical protein
MVANLAVFPAVVAMFIVARVFLANDQINNPSTSFVPPLVGNPNINDNIGILIAFGIILITPSILEIIKAALKAQGNSTVAQAITGGFMAGVGPGTALPRKYWGHLNEYDRQKGTMGALAGLRLNAQQKFGRKLFGLGANARRFQERENARTTGGTGGTGTSGGTTP